MTIQVLGTGCSKCKQLTANAEQAVADLGLDATIEKVTELHDIMEAGVMMTPALAIDGEVKAAGKVLSVDQIKQLIE